MRSSSPRASHAEHRMIVLSTDPSGGTGAYTMLANFVEATRDHPHRPVLILPRSSEIYDLAAGADYPVLALPAGKDRLTHHLAAIQSLMPLLRGARGVCAWHSRGFEMALWTSRRLGIPAVAIYHDPPDSPVHGNLRRALMRWGTQRFDARIFVSEATRKTWRAYTRSGISEVIHNGLPDRPLPLPPAAAPRVRIGFLGMYGMHKGFYVLRDWIDASTHLPVCWQLYGAPSPDLVNPIDAMVSAHPQHVMARGRQPTDEIFREIDILVHLSTSFDPFPTVLLEAARAGIPVVASNLGGSPEIVIDGETGFLYSPQDPAKGLKDLHHMVGDPGLRQQLGKAARRHFETSLTIAPMVDAYMDLWDRVAPVQSDVALDSRA